MSFRLTLDAGSAARYRLRGADAVYAGVALLFGTVLVSRDRAQLERLATALEVWEPERALARLST